MVSAPTPWVQGVAVSLVLLAPVQNAATTAAEGFWPEWRGPHATGVSKTATPPMRNQFGEGSTPVLHGGRLIVVWDHTGESFIVGLDARTGKEIWRQKRDEIDTWATPLVIEQGGRAQVVVAGMNRVRSYDLETGEIIWHAAGLTMNPIPSPVADDTLVYLMSGFRGNNLKAIRFADIAE